MVSRALFIWWQPAEDGASWVAIDQAWRALLAAFDTALEISTNATTQT